MRRFKAISLNQIQAIGPYAVALLALMIMAFVRVDAESWHTGVISNYLSVHIVLEFVGILVSFAIFTVGWSTYQNARDADILFLSLASFAVGALDLCHTLSFTGMPDFFGPSGPNKAIDFWFASRITGALAFLYVAISPPRLTRLKYLQWSLLIGATTWVAACVFVTLFRPHLLPVFYVPGSGLTPIKVTIEWILLAISVSAGVLLFVSAEKRENMNVRWMACASLLYGMCGYFFSIYNDFNDIYSLYGHCYKAVSYLLLYRAVFVECVSRPYERVQQLAAEAEASNLSKSRFLANVSHEFRTPLGVISGFGDLLLGSDKLDSNLHGWAQTIVRNAKQLSLLIDDLLDLAKAETEKIEIRLTRFEIGPLLEQVKQALGMQVHDQVSIKIQNHLPSPGFVVTDELRLRQILMNIVGNAVKFTAKGQILISAQRRDAGAIEILVEDSGIGIASSEAERLFQPFSQVSNPNRRHFGGTGLGLSLSRKLAELLGGNLNLKWSQPNKGSCFSIVFKDYPAEEAAAPGKSATAGGFIDPPSFAGWKILVAEDSEDNQMLLESYLKMTGVEITFAENGLMALECAAAGNFDLILMDIQMPEMDGFEATAELRRRGWQGRIVALTAHALQPERDRAMSNGFDSYLVKPIKREALWRAIANLQD